MPSFIIIRLIFYKLFSPFNVTSICKVSIPNIFNAEGGGSVTFQLHDKLHALVDLGKHIGMFKKDTVLPGSEQDEKFTGIRYTFVKKKETIIVEKKG